MMKETESKKNYKFLKMLDVNNSNLADIAELLGAAYNTILVKVSGKSDWKAAEIKKIKEHFNLTLEEVADIFF